MTEKEFYEALRSLKYRSGVGAGGRIRLTSFSKDALFDLCPITAVTMHETGQFFYSHDYAMAAKKLGLEKEFSEGIVDGADNRVFSPDHWSFHRTNERELLERSKKRRGEIIEALGMESEA